MSRTPRFGVGVQKHTIDQAVMQEGAAVNLSSRDRYWPPGSRFLDLPNNVLAVAGRWKGSGLGLSN